MTFNFNIFRILGDLSHAISHMILIAVIHSNRSAEGVSLLTQVLYVVVFSTRYVDLFYTSPFGDWHRWWNFVLKIYFITTSAYIVFVMTRVFARTREREKAMKLGGYATLGSLLLTPVMTGIFHKWHPFTFGENLWTFSIILESVAVLPQLLLLRQTNVPTVIDSFYLVTLGSYRGFYILNWLVRGFGPEHNFDPIRTLFGIIQTGLYIDFAWVYWTRQRVKLRAGGVVDSDDLSRSWFVGRVLGRKSTDADRDDFDYDAEAGDVPSPQESRPRNNKWGARGISVSADEGVLDGENGQASQPLTAPDAFEDDSDDEGDLGGKSSQKPAGEHFSGVSNGAEWREDRD
ncbi:ER lumen protein retaining receptor-domain-containing protein [Macrophomina phaseolina]|uniref:ER lumen protein retaining receptor-domain-containing protein n=1 Tax=Macrophomina phaseolina TaxID=35725 RepID=A0ABQ8FYR2_9PEZI|nr:ER lumen protein retaining receptor-domain-containing protein [Macrophomina phaseolina]